MKLLKILTILSAVVISLGNRKKLKRGIKIFGQEAKPHINGATDATCTCQTSSNCWLVGDPHLKSFYNHYDQVAPPDDMKLNIYTYEGFAVTCTTYSRDLMDNIHWGDNFEWHISDCNGKEKWLEPKEHTFRDGSTLTAKVKCRIKNKKIHINLLLTKSTSLTEAIGFDAYESKLNSTGVCIDKP